MNPVTGASTQAAVHTPIHDATKGAALKGSTIAYLLAHMFNMPKLADSFSEKDDPARVYAMAEARHEEYQARFARVSTLTAAAKYDKQTEKSMWKRLNVMTDMLDVSFAPARIRRQFMFHAYWPSEICGIATEWAPSSWPGEEVAKPVIDQTRPAAEPVNAVEPASALVERLEGAIESLAKRMRHLEDVIVELRSSKDRDIAAITEQTQAARDYVENSIFSANFRLNDHESRLAEIANTARATGVQQIADHEAICRLEPHVAFGLMDQIGASGYDPNVPLHTVQSSFEVNQDVLGVPDDDIGGDSSSEDEESTGEAKPEETGKGTHASNKAKRTKRWEDDEVLLAKATKILENRQGRLEKLVNANPKDGRKIIKMQGLINKAKAKVAAPKARIEKKKRLAELQ